MRCTRTATDWKAKALLCSEIDFQKPAYNARVLNNVKHICKDLASRRYPTRHDTISHPDRHIIMYTARCTAAYTVVGKLQYTVIYTAVYIVK
jgi:hypothetical protein